MMDKSILDCVGNTPLVRIENKYCSDMGIRLYGKLEGYNPSGSIKDRAASNILAQLLNEQIIHQDTTIIESSSGNFGIALASYCQLLNLKFICVVDPKIQEINETILKGLGAKLVKVNQRDDTGGYLKTRIQKVNELRRNIKNSIWINQYVNEKNALGYTSVANEIMKEINADYIFLGVSSGSTIYGVSRYIKQYHPNTKIIGVDVEGSVIFGQKPKERMISGIGSSIVPELITKSKFDDIVIVSEKETVEMCQYLLRENALFLGGSSGTVFGAIKKYFDCNKCTSTPNVVAVFADRGDRYGNTVYNDEWCQNNIYQTGL